MREHAPLRLVKHCARTGCRRAFRPWSKKQACCSRSCARKHSPVFRTHLLKVGRAGSITAAANKRRNAMTRWMAAVEGMTKVEIAKAFYRRGYKAAHSKNAQYYRAKGYEQALADLARAERMAS